MLNDFDGLSIRFWSLGLGVSGNKRATQNTLIQPWQKKEPANYRSLLAKREWNRRTGLIYFHMFCLFVFGRYNIESRWNMESVAGALQPIIRLAKVCSCQPFCWSWSHSAGSSTTSTAFRTEGCISYRTPARTRSNFDILDQGPLLHFSSCYFVLIPSLYLHDLKLVISICMKWRGSRSTPFWNRVCMVYENRFLCLTTKLFPDSATVQPLRLCCQTIAGMSTRRSCLMCLWTKVQTYQQVK